MVAVRMGWLGLLALLPCIMGARLPRQADSCQWVMQCETALFGFNDKTVRGVSVQACKQACRDETEFDCRSVDYVRDSESCYLSKDSAVTQEQHMGTHSGSDHYSYLCGDEQLQSVTPVEGTGCGFTKQCHTALFGFNTKTIEGMSLDPCMQACVDETDFDCLSFDYNPDSEICYLSEESADTQEAHMGPHFGADFYQKVCNGSGENEAGEDEEEEEETNEGSGW